MVLLGKGPSGQMLPYLIDDPGNTVGLSCGGLLAAQIMGLLLAAGLQLLLPSLGHRRNVAAPSTSFERWKVERNSVRIECVMPTWSEIRRVENRLVEKWFGHPCPPNKGGRSVA